jgi:hypothetical protein
MKTNSLIAVLSITLAVASSALASDKLKEGQETKPSPAIKSRDAQCPVGFKEEKVTPTGSYIKRTVHRNGRITDGMNQLIVLDHRTIEDSGASDLKQLLIRQGIR